MFNVTLNNISAISWWSDLLVEEAGVPRENHIPAASHWQTFFLHNIYHVHLAWVRFELTTLVVICTDCIGGCKSSYRTITTTRVPEQAQFEDTKM
jgi:hypothetical protein